MALAKIKQANKKWKHELKRKSIRAKLDKKKQAQKQQTALLRKQLVTERREQLRRRETELAYVENLKETIVDEKVPEPVQQ